MGAPIVDIHGSIGPAGVSRPKHKRTFTGFGAGEIKNVEGKQAQFRVEGPKDFFIRSNLLALEETSSISGHRHLYISES